MTDISLRFDSYRQTETRTNGPTRGADAVSFESLLPRDSASDESRRADARGTDDIPSRANDNARADRASANEAARHADARDRNQDRDWHRDRLAAADRTEARDRARDTEAVRNKDRAGKERTKEADALDGSRRRSLENAIPLKSEMQVDPTRGGETGDRIATAVGEDREPAGNGGATGPDPRVVFANQHRNDPREAAGEAPIESTGNGNAGHPFLNGLPVDDSTEPRGEAGDAGTSGTGAAASVEALLAALAALEGSGDVREGDATDTNPAAVAGAGLGSGVAIPGVTGTGETGDDTEATGKATEPAPTLASAAPSSMTTANDNKAAASRETLIDLIARLEARLGGTAAKATGEQGKTATVDLDTASRKDLLDMVRSLAASAGKAGVTLNADDRAAIRAVLAAQDVTTAKPATDVAGPTAGRTAGAETARIADPAVAATDAPRTASAEDKTAARLAETVAGNDTTKARDTAQQHSDRPATRTASETAAQTATRGADARAAAIAAAGATGAAETTEPEGTGATRTTAAETITRPAAQAAQTTAAAAQATAQGSPARGRATTTGASTANIETADDAKTAKTGENGTRTANANQADAADRTAVMGEAGKPKPVTHADLSAAANREPSRVAAEAKAEDAGAKSGSGDMKTAAQALTDAAKKAAGDAPTAASAGKAGERADTAAALTNVAAMKTDVFLSGSSSDQLMVLQSDQRMGHDAMTQVQRATVTLSRGTPVVPGVAAEIARFASKGDSRFEIRLDPPELGRVDVRLKVKDDGTVKAHLFVERSETLDGFLRDQRGLERALEQAGLKTDSGSLQFSLKSDTGTGEGGTFAGNDNGSPGWTASDDTGDSGEMDRMSAVYSTAALDGRLDIRV